MKAVLVGVQKVSFENENNGEIIDGVKIHMLYPDEWVHGLKADTKFIKTELFNHFDCNFDDLKNSAENNLEVNLDYGPRNKIVNISILKPVE